MTRSVVWLALLVSCTEKRVPAPTPTPSAIAPTDEREMTIVVERCLPVGYGMHCGGTIDGRPVSLQACVGAESTPNLMQRLGGAPIAGQDGGRPVTIQLKTKVVGVLDAAYSSDYCGGLLFEDTKEHLHALKVL